MSRTWHRPVNRLNRACFFPHHCRHRCDPDLRSGTNDQGLLNDHRIVAFDPFARYTGLAIIRRGVGVKYA